jgi:hypothetical protein
MLMSICKICIRHFVGVIGLVGHIWVKHHLRLCVWWSGRAIIRIMAEIYSEPMCEKVRALKTLSIPPINPMKWHMRMSGNTTGIAPKARSEAIPTSICAGRLLAMRADGLGRKGLVSKKFYENTIPSI